MNDTLKALRELGVELTHKFSHAKSGNQEFSFFLANTPDPIAVINDCVLYTVHKATADCIGTAGISAADATKKVVAKLASLQKGNFPTPGGTRELDPVDRELRGLIQTYLKEKAGWKGTEVTERAGTLASALKSFGSVIAAAYAAKYGPFESLTTEADKTAWREGWQSAVEKNLAPLRAEADAAAARHRAVANIEITV